MCVFCRHRPPLKTFQSDMLETTKEGEKIGQQVAHNRKILLSLNQYLNRLMHCNREWREANK